MYNHFKLVICYDITKLISLKKLKSCKSDKLLINIIFLIIFIQTGAYECCTLMVAKRAISFFWKTTEVSITVLFRSTSTLVGRIYFVTWPVVLHLSDSLHFNSNTLWVGTDINVYLDHYVYVLINSLSAYLLHIYSNVIFLNNERKCFL